MQYRQPSKLVGHQQYWENSKKMSSAPGETPTITLLTSAHARETIGADKWPMRRDTRPGCYGGVLWG